MKYFLAKIGLMALAVAVVANSAFPPSEAIAQTSQMPQTTDSTPAREAPTSPLDIQLTNRCIESGQSKGHCLCLTKIYKYELTIGEYRRVSKHYSFTGQQPKQLMAAMTSGSAAAALSAVGENSAMPANFNARCNAADDYFISQED